MFLKTITTFMSVGLKTILIVFLPLAAFTVIAFRSPVLLGIRAFIVQTGSMEPTVPVGSIVFMQTAKNYQKGDVITFKRGDKTVTHRINQVVYQNGMIMYQTKGDANNAADEQLVATHDIIGKGIFQVITIGKYISYLRTVPGVLVSVVLPALFFICTQLWDIKNEIVRSTEERVRRELKANGLWQQNGA